MGIMSLDCETTGLDFYHGVKPYLVTTCNENGQIKYWEWYVNGITRQPEIEDGDIEEIIETIDTADEIVFHNAKFDIHALATILPPSYSFPFRKIHDTLTAAHLTRSNLKKDLTTLANEFLYDSLKENISKYEDNMERCVKEAHRWVRSNERMKFRIAKKDKYKDMPSAKEKTWKYDSWLPRTLARHRELPLEHEWWTVTSIYANKDSEVTLPLWYCLRDMMEWDKTRKLYDERMKLIEIFYKIEDRGITGNKKRAKQTYAVCERESERYKRICRTVARERGVELEIGKGINRQTRDFIHNTLKLEKVYNQKTHSANPTLNKDALEHYKKTLDTTSKELLFIKALSNKSKADVSCRYMRSYSKFWIPKDSATNWTVVLHPNFNITGTATLRASGNNPNPQNFSKSENEEGYSLRYFLGPDEGREWYSIDANNIELRIPFYKAEEYELIALFEKPNDPPFYGSYHMLIFSILWPKIWEDAIKKVGYEKAADYCKKEYKSTYYQWTKNGDFAVQYGAIDKDDGTGTADRAYHQPGAQAKVKSRFSKLEKLNQDCIRFANKHGYIETLPDKEVDPNRGYPLRCSRTRGRISPTIPLNYKIQGSAMWWTARAMVKTNEQLDRWRDDTGFNAYITMQVHDEIVFDFPKANYTPLEAIQMEKEDRVRYKEQIADSNLWRIRQIAKLMESCGDAIGIPTPVGIEYHANNWQDGVKIK